MKKLCPHCKSEMYQEHTKMYDRNHPENTHLVDNWHCKVCKSVFTNSEIRIKETNLISNCCSAPIIAETDLCSRCQDHCEPILEELDEEEKQDIINDKIRDDIRDNNLEVSNQQ
jgi:hypothetical protein